MYFVAMYFKCIKKKNEKNQKKIMRGREVEEINNRTNNKTEYEL